MGPWELTETVPTAVQRLAPVEDEKEARERAAAAKEEAGEEPDLGSTTPPTIIMATVPTELIVTDGEPEYKPVGADLLYIDNSESDVLVEIATQRHFVLLPGRWFAAPGVDGPWSFVASDALPESFKEIPEDSDIGHLRVWVAGTEEATEAVLDASIPQTAAIRRDATIAVVYDGNPRFEDIEETGLSYATNTSEQVIKHGNKYYCVKDGVWYVADQAYGPWVVATEIPEEIREIPTLEPGLQHQVRLHLTIRLPRSFMSVTTPATLTATSITARSSTGPAGTTRHWWGTHYYPRTTTYGFHVRWNPWYGWSFGFSYSTGRFTFGIGFGGWHRGYWGPVGYRPYYRGYARGWHHGYRRGVRAGYAAGRLDSRYRAQNLYRRNNVPRTTPANRARVQNRAATTRARPATNRPNNMYTDRSGNVHQRTQNGQWQQRTGRLAMQAWLSLAIRAGTIGSTRTSRGVAEFSSPQLALGAGASAQTLREEYTSEP